MSGEDVEGSGFYPCLDSSGGDGDNGDQTEAAQWVSFAPKTELNGKEAFEESTPLQATSDHKEDGGPVTEMTYDELLTSLGEWGWRQKLVSILSAYHDCNLAIQLVSSLFIMAVVPHRCAIPWLANDTWTIQNDQHALLVNLSIPPGKTGEPYSRCNLYTEALQNQSSLLSSARWGLSLPEGNGSDSDSDSQWQNSSGSVESTTACDRYVYDTSEYESSISIDLNLVCGRSLYRSHAQMMVMGGCLVGSQLGGLIADRWGRKTSMMIFMLVNIASMFSLTFVRHYVTLLALTFCVGLSALGCMCPGFIIALEVMGPSKRIWLAPYSANGFSTGLLILCCLAYFIREWTQLQLAAAAFTLPYLAFWWLVPESPRWLLNKGRIEEAKVILQRFARANKKPFDPAVLEKLNLNNTAQESLCSGLFKAKRLMGRYLIVFFAWFTASFSFYGVTLNMGNLAGSIYLNMLIGALLDVAVVTLCAPVMARVGRRPLSSVLFLITGLACIATLFPVIYAPKEYQWITVVLALIGKGAIAIEFAVVWVYAPELFPTVLRNSGQGAASLSARVGGILAPYVANMSLGGAAGKAVPLVIFGVPALLISLLTLCLPETLHRPLPDSLQDALLMTRKWKKPTGSKLR